MGSVQKTGTDIDRDMMRDRHSLREMKKAPLFFVLFFAWVFLVFLYLIRDAALTSYQPQTLGVDGNLDLVMLDGEDVSLTFLLLQDHPWGLSLNQYYDDEVKYGDEDYLSVQVINADSGDIEQESRILLKDQYSEKAARGMLLIPFSGDYSGGTNLTVLLQPHLTEGKWFLLRLSKDYVNYAVTDLSDGPKPGWFLDATVYYSIAKNQSHCPDI